MAPVRRGPNGKFLPKEAGPPRNRGSVEFRARFTGLEVDLLNTVLNDVYPKSDGPTRKRIANIQRKLDTAARA